MVFVGRAKSLSFFLIFFKSGEKRLIHNVHIVWRDEFLEIGFFIENEILCRWRMEITNGRRAVASYVPNAEMF